MNHSQTSPEGGMVILGRLGGGNCVPGWPCGKEMFLLNQQRLSSQIDSARFLNVLV